MWVCNSNAASNGPPPPPLSPPTAKTCQGGGGEEEMAGKGGNTIRPHISQFSSQHSASYAHCIRKSFLCIRQERRKTEVKKEARKFSLCLFTYNVKTCELRSYVNINRVKCASLALSLVRDLYFVCANFDSSGLTFSLRWLLTLRTFGIWQNRRLGENRCLILQCQ